jgi:uridine kinase
MLSGRGAYIDRLYYCPHHPDRGFPGEVAELKVVCTCRKPNTGLVDRATAELNVARDRSWMIGDSTTDVLLARRAGLKSILVETGKAGLDGRAAALPDFVVPDLAAAVDFILDEYPGLAALADEIGASVPAGGLVFIGGLSRGGKTTLSNALRIALERLGRRSIVLGADRWLLDAADRGSGVLKRYEIDEITRIAAMLIEKQHDVELSLPIYDRLTRRRSDRVEEVVIRCDDVVIIEGTVVLRVASQLRWQRNLFYVETDEELRRERVLREYRVRGCEPSEAEAIYAGRQQDESPEVMGTATIAQRRIFLPLSGAKPAGNYAAAAGGVAQ